MQRINFTLDDETLGLLSTLATKLYGGNKSLTIREALQALATQHSTEGWVVKGYVPVVIDEDEACTICGRACHHGDVFYRPVFERGTGPHMLHHLPTVHWLECRQCAEKQV